MSRKKKHSQRERFRAAQLTTNKIADLASEVTDSQFNHRMLMLKQIVDIWGDGGDISVKRLNDSVSDIDNVVRSASDVSLLSSVSPASANFSCNILLERCSINNAGSSSGISLQSSADNSVKSVLDSIAVNSPFDVPLETYSINNGVSASEIPLLSSVDSPVRTALDNAVNSLSDVPLECYSIDNVVSASDVLSQSPVRSVAAKKGDINDAIIDKDLVDIKIVRPFFSGQAWDAIQIVLKRKEKKDDWKCSICDHSLDGQSICCDKCLFTRNCCFISVIRTEKWLIRYRY